MNHIPVAFFALSFSSAHAVLIEADLVAPGDGLLTRDTQTGLEWLDLTAASGSIRADPN